VRELCDWRADTEAANSVGLTPLQFASVSGRVDVVRELLARGADPNTAEINGETPLIASSRWGQVESVRALLAAGADKHRATRSGVTAYSVAATVSRDYMSPVARATILALLANAP
jgi:ankyrin repeat protein